MNKLSSQQEIDLANNMAEGCKLNKKQQNSLTNNNDQDYDYNLDPNGASHLVSGRVSGGSNESAFSSASSEADCSQLCDSACEQNSSSGRSSANRDSLVNSLDDVKVLNPNSNLVPEVSEALTLVDTIRVRFLDSLKTNKEDRDLYEASDLEEIQKPLPPITEWEQSLAFRIISRFVNFRQILASRPEDKVEQDLETALASLKEFLKFRHQYQLTDTLPEHFSKEFYLLNGIFAFGHDKQDLPVLYIRARVHRKWSARFDESFRRYVAWQVNSITKSYNGAKVSKTVGNNSIEKDGSFGICFDCLNVSYSCLDMDFLRFLVSLLVHYYPTYCRYAWCVDLPWLFRSVWKLVRSWLPEEAQKTVQLITSKQLIEFIDEDQIPNSIKFNDKKASEKPTSGKHQFPINYDAIKDIDGLGKELELSSSEIKQFKSHVDKIVKEYEQLGAL